MLRGLLLELLLLLLLLRRTNWWPIAHVSPPSAASASPSTSSVHIWPLPMSVGEPEPRPARTHHWRPALHHPHVRRHLGHNRHLVRHHLLEHHRIHPAHHLVHHHLLRRSMWSMSVHLHSSPTTSSSAATVHPPARHGVNLRLDGIKVVVSSRRLYPIEQAPHRLRLVSGGSITHGARPIREVRRASRFGSGRWRTTVCTTFLVLRRRRSRRRFSNGMV